MADYRLEIKDGESAHTLRADGRWTLLEELRRSGILVEASCGGLGKCGKCGVSVSGPCRRTDGGRQLFREERVLSCTVYPAGDLTVTLPRREGQRILTDDAPISGGGTGLGLAVDIGTTTVAAYLYDLPSGICLAKTGEVNAQRAYGADVISRIQYTAAPGGLAVLSGAIRRQIEAMAAKLTADTGDIAYVAVSGNTVMEHIFTGLSPVSIGVTPYTPLDTFGREYAAGAFFSGFAASCRVYVCPAVSGFVGGDITAGLLSSGLYQSAETCLFVDIGTNGEIALGSEKGFICCATAAGPAFEGGEIACGSPARTGAISAVDEQLGITVLGGGAPEGICGSGLVDAAAALLQCGRLEESGRLNGERYEFGNGVYLSQRDIRQLQTAKAAIRAGIDTVAALSGAAYDAIARVYIAGGFGAALHIKNACAIGLLPSQLAERITYVGNASGRGAAMALCAGNRRLLRDIQRKCHYEELSESPQFTDKYIGSMIFGEPDEE